MTKTQVILLSCVGVLIVAAITVKLIFFPGVSEKYFTVNSTRLKTVPSGYIVIRPTHSVAQGAANRNRIAYASVNRDMRIVGVNVTFHTLIALTYNQDPSLITIPWNAPTNINYDILVTARGGGLSQHLQSAIRSKLGFTADIETNEVPVVALKIENTSVETQAFKPSPDSEKTDTNMKNGRLFFTHTQLSTIMNGIEQIVKSPVVDETGLTNYYDFSLVWNRQMQQEMQNGSFSKDTGEKILESWGLGMEPDTAPMAMLVVKKAH